jgi:hypothetical protein
LFNKPGRAVEWRNNQERFRKACSILKSRMVRWWKRAVTRSLSNWIDSRHPHIRRQFDDSEPIVQLETQMLQRVKYAWRDGGRPMYAKWYTIRMSDSCLDLVPGSDDVARAANSTWYEWEEGSRPFHFINASSKMD